MSIEQTILNQIQSAIDVPMMDVNNVSSLIIGYVKEDRLSYWKGEYRGFYCICVGADNIGYIPVDDKELLECIKQLVNYCGWENRDKSVRLDISSWKHKRQAIRDKIFSLKESFS